LVGLDLNAGIDSFIAKSEDNVGDVAHIFKALDHSKFDVEEQKIDFVTYRNNLNKIMGALYLKEPWEIRIDRQKSGLIVLDIVKLKSSETFPLENNRFIYYGYKFEQYCTFPDRVDSSYSNDLNNRPVDANSEYCAIFKTRFDQNRVIIGAEMDCVDSLNQFIELKTSRIQETPNQERNFKRFKLLKYWIQSYLVNTLKIIVGYRTDDGKIASIQQFRTNEIPSLCSQYWDSKSCIAFTTEILNFIKTRTSNSNQYLLKFSEPFSSIQLFE
jgi:RAT1-interacting protein